MKPTMGSLFAGIGGFDLGFTRAGFDVAWQVEIDPWCRRVLAKHFPEAERFEDVRTVGKHNLRPVDVICGGFPCQDISNAGLRAGIDGERSGLWSEYARIIGELRPKYVLVENVAALLSDGMGRVVGDLAEIGYDAEWEIVSAADVGAPHLRERVWILAYPMCKRYGTNSIERYEPREARPPEGSIYRSPCATIMANPDRDDVQGKFTGCADPQEWTLQRERQARSCGSGGIGFWAVEPDVGRVADGIPDRSHRLKGLGNAVVPAIPEMYAHRIKAILDDLEG